MEIALEKTNSSRIARAMVKARVAAGSPAMDMVLTLLVVTDDENVGEALKTATTLSREHPSRVIGVILGDGRGAAELNAKVRVGENSSGESILLRISGELTKHAESVVLPLAAARLPRRRVVAGQAADRSVAGCHRAARPAPPDRRRGDRLAHQVAQERRAPLRRRRHRPVVDAPDPVACAAGRRARPVRRQGHRRNRHRRQRQPRSHPARRLAREPPQGRHQDAQERQRSADHVRSCSTRPQRRRADRADHGPLVPLQRAWLLAARGAARRRARSPSCWPRTCAGSTPTMSTRRRSSTCWPKHDDDRGGLPGRWGTCRGDRRPADAVASR